MFYESCLVERFWFRVYYDVVVKMIVGVIVLEILFGIGEFFFKVVVGRSF